MENILKRKEILSNAKRIVIKIGTRVLTTNEGRLDENKIQDLVSDIAYLKKNGKEIIIVTSGAIVSGMGRLDISKRPKEIPKKQALAAIGQSRLMHIYDKYFQKENISIGQMLLTADDLTDRKRFLNAGNTLNTLLNFKAVPIINENDTIAIEEIKFGDNDNLSVQVVNLSHADILIILTDIDGLFTADPREDKKAKFIPCVEKINGEIEKLAGDSTDDKSIGGMRSKIQAAKKVIRSGVGVIVANGKKKKIISRIFLNASEGTFFLPDENKMAYRKRWIAFSSKKSGILVVDDGAYIALINQGKSLLPSGITNLSGKFKVGDRVIVTTSDGKEFASGLVNYSSEELEKIKGRKTTDIQNILGYKDCDEVIHRDNLVILSNV